MSARQAVTRPSPGRPRRRRPPRTRKDRIIDAALETLKEEGLAGTSARAIASRGRFNQALIFYHFGGLDQLLLGALDRASSERLARYKEAMASRPPGEILRIAADLYREDLASGHITVLSEMIAASLSKPHLRQAILGRMEPWIDFAEETLRPLLGGAGLEALVPARTAALGVVASYLGMNLLSHLDEDRSRVEALFAAADRLGTLLLPFLGHGGLR